MTAHYEFPTYQQCVEAADAVDMQHWFIAVVAVFNERLDLSIAAIGRAFNRDRTTIVYALRKSLEPAK
ncbi:MAG: hypothetical protein AAF713_01880 [Pseudomonadota bacterium]